MKKISDFILEIFTQKWKNRLHNQRAIVWKQSHGTPVAILDLYAARNIPETTRTDILRIQYVSSVPNIAYAKYIAIFDHML